MIQLNELKREFDALINLPRHEKMLTFCALITAFFEKDSIKPIIVGGLSIEVYTRNNYTTFDIDLIMDGRGKLDDLLIYELGFTKEGRSWYHKRLELSIEIPGNFLEGNKDKVMQMKLESGKYVYLIGIEDIIIHRLESAIVSQPKNPDWTDDYEWAKRMFEIHKSDTEIMDKEYLLQASRVAQVDTIISDWLEQ